MAMSAPPAQTKPREVPWTALQTAFPTGTKFREAIEQMDLNYSVEFRKLYVDGVGEAPAHRATIRTDTNAVLGVVGSRYSIIQNADAFGFLESVVDSGELQPIGAGFWKGGARPWVQARLPEDIVVGGFDRITPLIFIATSHDGSIPMTTALSGIRVVCENTYAANVYAPRRFAVRHTGDRVHNVEEARRVLNISFAYFKEYGEFMESLAQTNFADAEFEGLVNALFPKPLKATDQQSENIAKKRAALLAVYLNSPTVPRGTKYGALQAVTEWYDHVKNGGRKRDTREAAELKSRDLLLGDAIEFKDRAVALLTATA